MATNVDSIRRKLEVNNVDSIRRTLWWQTMWTEYLEDTLVATNMDRV